MMETRRYAYIINGRRYGKEYFMSFGFTNDEIQAMIDGEIITKGRNEFWMRIRRDD